MTTKSIKDEQGSHTVPKQDRKQSKPKCKDGRSNPPQWSYKQNSSSSRETWKAFTSEASKYIEQVWVCFQQNDATCKRVVENGNHHYKVNVKTMTYEKQNTVWKGKLKREANLRTPVKEEK